MEKKVKISLAQLAQLFPTKTNTIMHNSNLGFKKWAWAIYLIATSIKGIASTKLASDLGITQKVALYIIPIIPFIINRVGIK